MKNGHIFFYKGVTINTQNQLFIAQKLALRKTHPGKFEMLWNMSVLLEQRNTDLKVTILYKEVHMEEIISPQLATQ